MSSRINILIPMAGLGSRFQEAGYKLPKPLIDINGVPMIQRAVESLNIEGQYIFLIYNYSNINIRLQLENKLKELKQDCHIIVVKERTEGASCTALLAKEYINNDSPLIITNCDQIMHWDAKKFINHIVKSSHLDGIVVTYRTITDKNSYIKLDNEEFAIEIAEKKVIGPDSLNGIHYWKHGYDFVSSAEEMISINDRVNNEFYIAPTYNYMIKKNKKIGVYRIEDKEHCAVGTPEDLIRYLKTHENK